MKTGLLAIALSGALLTGCVISIDDDFKRDNDHNSSWSHTEQENREQISELAVGADISKVRKNMGTPDFDELIVKDDKEYRVLFYRTQRIKRDGNTTKEECTPILFVNGELIGFGETALNAI